MDILIRNGWVADGTGNPLYPADVMIGDDRIVAVERLHNAQAARIIDAGGKIVCPGFIDCHSHTDWTIHTNPTVQSTIRQGVTTEIVGNCGMGNAPTSDLSREYVTNRLREYCYEGPITWSTFAEYLDAISQMGTSCNLAWFVSHGAIRESVGIGSSTKSSDVTKEQMHTMENHVREAMEAGAYELVFHAGDYLRTQGVSLSDPPFLDRVVIRFGIVGPHEDYHVPLLLSPFGYSTYRGS